jgi:hypothetical protein
VSGSNADPVQDPLGSIPIILPMAATRRLDEAADAFAVLAPMPSWDLVVPEARRP